MKTINHDHECLVIEFAGPKPIPPPQHPPDRPDIIGSIKTAIASVQGVFPNDKVLLIVAGADSYERVAALLQQFRKKPDGNSVNGKGHLSMVVRDLDKPSGRKFELWKPA
ncbi:MAG TPA: hypothetical protein VGN20_13975 [Mucilaginibacter sp.]|jgi:hypothetical protein